jgi:hypothetical protein
VTLLTELINDEEDDELSKKAYECLEILGDEVIMKQIEIIQKAIKSRSEYTWK